MNKQNQAVTVTITNRTVVRIVVLVIASILAFRVLDDISHILTLIFVAFFLALALNPAVSRIAKALQTQSRAMATGIAYIIVLSLLGLFIWTVVPPLVRQSVEFVNDIPPALSSVESQDTALGRFVRRYELGEQLDELGTDIKRTLEDNLPSLSGQVVNTVTRGGGTLVSIITVIVLTFMMLVEGPRWLERAQILLPADKRERYRRLALKMYRVVTGYVNGQLLIAVLAAAFALVALLIASTIFEVSVNAVALAGIVAVIGLIPMIGNTIAASIVVLVCMFSSVGLAITMAAFFIVYQQIENITIQPYIQSKYNELTPLLVFVAALLGIGFGGLLGALVAIPVAGCLKIVVDDYLERRGISKVTADTSEA